MCFTDFESGNPFNSPAGSSVVTTDASSSPTHSLTFTALGSGGDAFTAPIAVNAGQTYSFTTDYYSKGDGGFLGVGLYSDAAGTNSVGEQWLFGDSSYAATTALPDGATSGFSTYTASYAIPAGVVSVRLKGEDFAMSAGTHSPSTNPVYFDNIGMI